MSWGGKGEAGRGRAVGVTGAACALALTGCLGALTSVGPAGAADGTLAPPPTAAIGESRVCTPPRTFLDNASFEEPTVATYAVLPQEQVPGWRTTASDGTIEVWNQANAGYAAPDGTQWAEINANSIGTLYQDVDTTPGEELGYITFHRGRSGPNTAEIQVGPPGGPVDLVVTMTDDSDVWGYYVGSYTVPPGRTVTRFAFAAVTGSGPDRSIGNFIDAAQFGTLGCARTTIAATDLDGGAVQVGDELEYTVTTTNIGGFAITDPVQSLWAPEGTRYVPDSAVLVGGARAGDLTDADDGDAARVTPDGVLEVQLGGLAYGLLRAGEERRVSYRVVVESSAAGGRIVNASRVDYRDPGGEQAYDSWTQPVALDVPAPSPSPTVTSGPTAVPTPTTGPTGTVGPTGGPTSTGAPTPSGGPEPSPTRGPSVSPLPSASGTAPTTTALAPLPVPPSPGPARAGGPGPPGPGRAGVVGPLAPTGWDTGALLPIAVGLVAVGTLGGLARRRARTRV